MFTTLIEVVFHIIKVNVMKYKIKCYYESMTKIINKYAPNSYVKYHF